jgi:glycosyltransferase involved in cell wall biosynthesis
MKLFIQIPCFNEEKTLPSVISNIPSKIEGIDEIYTLVIDDGSTDNTVEVAKQLGVDYVVRNRRNLGLAESYIRGLDACLCLGADIVVNTDGDNQYACSDIEKLVKPILEKQADIVIGCRNIDDHKEFSRIKKYLQKLGSKVVSCISGTNIPDVTSGFRAINRKAAINISIMNKYTYTVDTLIQAGRTGMKIESVPIKTNPSLRESRLFKSIPEFIIQQIIIMVKVFIFYCPMRFFLCLASVSFVLTVLNALRILYYLFFAGTEDMKFKEGSGVLLLFSAFVTVLFVVAGLFGLVLSGFRLLVLDIRNRIRDMEIQQNILSPDLDLIINRNLTEKAASKTKIEDVDSERQHRRKRVSPESVPL